MEKKEGALKTRKGVREIALQLAVTAAGTFIMAFGNRAFLNVYNIVPGGFTGLALIINGALLPFFPPGILALIFNIPLFVIGWKALGNRFGFLTLTGTVLYSLFIDIIPLFGIDMTAITAGGTGGPDLLLATVYGGALFGIGYGLIIRNGGSTGGTDLLANIIQNKKPHFSFGSLLLLIDGFVVLLSGLAFGLNKALYAFITIFLSSKIADYLIDGKKAARAYYIVTGKAEELSAALFRELKRGVTCLKGKGMYSGEERDILLCIVLRTQAGGLRRIAGAIDPRAFIFSSNVTETYGEGFIRLSPFSLSGKEQGARKKKSPS